MSDAIVPPECVDAAITEACRHTKEKPADCVNGVTGIRARHYAMHALRSVFADTLSGRVAAALVGCPGKPHTFYGNSQNQTAGLLANGERVAKWWDEKAAYQRVITAIVDTRAIVAPPKPVPAPAPPPAPRPPAKAEPKLAPPIEKAAAPVAQKKRPPNFATIPTLRPTGNTTRSTDYDRVAYVPVHSQNGGTKQGSRKALYDMLAEAAANTAKMQPK